jgi:thiazole/oxazole-forming peptide maturase SagC family component
MRLQVTPRFKVLKLGSGKYRFVSLLGSTTVTADDTRRKVLDAILPALEAGCSEHELLDRGSSQEWSAHIVDIVAELETRGLVDRFEVSQDQRAERVNAELYAEQKRFLANFRPYDDEPDSDVLPMSGSSALPQERLSASGVLLVGLGRFGSLLAKGLAHAGVGHLCGWDSARVTMHDTIDSSFSCEDVGHTRQYAIERVIRSANPSIDYTPLEHLLSLEQNAGIVPEDVEMLVLCQDEFDPEIFEAVNKFCLERGMSWISQRNLGHRVEVGPLIVPGETACFRCLELRRTSNLTTYGTFLDSRRRLVEDRASLGTLNITLGYELLAVEVMKFLTGFSRPATYGAVVSLDLLSLQTKAHPLLRIPRCPECSAIARENRPTASIWRAGELLEDR